MAPNFSSILDRAASEVEAPKPFPIGSYVCIVKGLPRFDKSSKKQTEFAEFTLQPISVLEDVDPDALEEFGGFADKTLRTTFYLTEEAIYRLKDFLVNCGIEPEGKTLSEMINETPGQTVIAVVGHRASEDGERIFAEVKKTLAYGD
jgi:hypothetical protein